MNTEEMSREDITAALAKKLKMRKDGIDALELDTDKLRADYDSVKHGNYWNWGEILSYGTGGLSLANGLNGDIGVLPSVAGFGFDNNLVESAGFIGFVASLATLTYQGRQVSGVRNELQNEITDRLIELKNQELQVPKPSNV